MKTTPKLMKQVERLIEAIRTRDRLTIKHGGDPDRDPFRVIDAGKYLTLKRGGKRPMTLIVTKVDSVVWFHFGGSYEREGTIGRQIKKWEARVQEARDQGEVEYPERQRLDALAGKCVVGGWVKPSWAYLLYLRELGIAIRWKKVTATAARKEQRELKQRLSQIG